MTNHSSEIGKRATKVAARNRAIEDAAMALANARQWPSPAAVAERAGVSDAVVRREIPRLQEARRRWMKRTGRTHPQWRDHAPPTADGTTTDTDGPAPATEGAEPATAANGDAAPPDVAQREKAGSAALRRQNRELRGRVAEMKELNRRMNLGVRPDEVALILEKGSVNGGSRKADKGVRIGVKKDVRADGDGGAANDGL